MQKKAFFLLLLWLLSGIYAVNAQDSSRHIQAKLPNSTTINELKDAKAAYLFTTLALNVPGSKKIIKNGSILYVIDPKQMNIDSLLQLPGVLFIQPVRTATEEMVINGSDLSLNNIFYAHNRFPGVTGKGLTVSIKENRPDTPDIDFKKRFISTGLETATLSSHATIMATLIGGAGNTYYTGKGAAYKANLSSASFQTLLPENDSVYRKFNITLQNHSYGTAIENFYGADSWAYDLSVNNNDSLLHVFSAGNSGNLASTSGKYAGMANVANLTGSFKQSKNSLSAGATDSLNHVEILSSRGPAYDGRIKPELVAFGQDGSSGAAALLSGAALLVQDAFKQSKGHLPRSSLVRAALVNAADDILQPGPDFISGFGSLNAERAVREILNDQFFSGTVANGGNVLFNITVPANVKELKITLAWNDIAAMPNAAKALVNDLDLEVMETSTGNVYYPLVLSSYPHTDSLNALAVQKRDTLNNIEQVVIGLPAAGNYALKVKGSAVQGNQSFDLVYNTETMDAFYFTYPAKNDNLFPAAMNTIRWQSFTNSATNGSLEISYNGGATWETLNTSVPLQNKYFKTLIKDTVSTGRLRMSFPSAAGAAVVLSDTFTITPRLQTGIGYNCTDSFQMHWNKLPGISSYYVYALTDSFMRPQYQVTDTFITIHPGDISYFAVAPNISGKTGVRSFAFDFHTQGVGCFINNLLADPGGDSVVNLTAVLGTRQQVNKITFQRLYPVTDIAFFAVNKDTFTTTDRITREGIYYYRAKLLLNNGSEVISDTVQVVIFKQKNFFVYPNPYRNGGRLIIQSKDYDKSSFELFNAFGQKIFSRRLVTNIESLSLPFLQRGIYFYRILQDDQKVFSGKLMID